MPWCIALVRFCASGATPSITNHALVRAQRGCLAFVRAQRSKTTQSMLLCREQRERCFCLLRSGNSTANGWAGGAERSPKGSTQRDCAVRPPKGDEIRRSRVKIDAPRILKEVIVFNSCPWIFISCVIKYIFCFYCYCLS